MIAMRFFTSAFTTFVLFLSVTSCGFLKKEKVPSAPVSVPVTAPKTSSYTPRSLNAAPLRNPNVALSGTFQGGEASHSFGNRSKPYIAMTFDDGPHPVHTPRLLDMLKRRNIRATFYVIGHKVERYPHIIRRIVAEGHEIGNHTWKHDNLTKLSNAQIIADLQRSTNAIAKVTGVRPRTMRPPYGALYSAQRQMVYNRLGMPSILWDVDPQDWKRPGPSVVSSRIVNGTKPGSIVLAHDLHGPTVDAMPAALDGLLRKGHQFVTVSQLLAQKGQ